MPIGIIKDKVVKFESGSSFRGREETVRPMNAISAPRLFRRRNEAEIVRGIAAEYGLQYWPSPEELKAEPMQGMLVTVRNMEQEEAVVYALAGTYAQKIWGDMLPEIQKQFPGIRPVLQGMRNGNMSYSVIQNSVEKALHGRDLDQDTAAAALHHIFAAWQLRYQVVEQHQPLRLWPPVFSDPMYAGDIYSFTPVLQCVRGKFWKFGWEGDSHPDSPKIYRGRNWDRVLSEIYNIYRSWYRVEQESLLRRYLKIDPKKRHVLDPFWMQILMDKGELDLGTIHLLFYPGTTVAKASVDELSFVIDTMRMFPPDLVRAAIEYSGKEPPFSADPESTYLAMLSLTQDEPCKFIQSRNSYSVTFSRISSYLADFPTEIKIRWSNNHAVVSGNRSPLKFDIFLVDDKVEVVTGSTLVERASWQGLDPSSEKTRVLISLWAMWLWQLSDFSLRS